MTPMVRCPAERFGPLANNVLAAGMTNYFWCPKSVEDSSVWGLGLSCRWRNRLLYIWTIVTRLC